MLLYGLTACRLAPYREAEAEGSYLATARGRVPIVGSAGSPRFGDPRRLVIPLRHSTGNVSWRAGTHSVSVDANCLHRGEDQ